MQIWGLEGPRMPHFNPKVEFPLMELMLGVGLKSVSNISLCSKFMIIRR